MDYYLKKKDVLISEKSSVDQNEIINYLNNMFHKMEEKDGLLGYADVFDTRTNSFYRYYSDKSKAHYSLGSNRYNLVREDILTKANFMEYLNKKISDIVDVLNKNGLSSIKQKLKVFTGKIKDGKIKTNDNIQGDIVNSIAKVEIQNNVYEEYDCNINKNNEIIVADDTSLDGKDATVTYLK